MSRNILVIKHGAFGDLLAIEGALRDIRRHHVKDRLYLLTTPPYKKMMASCPWLDGILLDDRKPRWRFFYLYRLRHYINAYRFSMVYDLQCSRRTDFYYRYLLSDLTWSGSAKHCQFPIDREYDNGVKRLEIQLRNTGVDIKDTPSPDLRWLVKKDVNIQKRLGLESDYVVLLFGSSKRNSHKRWPHFAALADKLKAAGLRSISLPGPDEIEQAKAIGTEVILEDHQSIDQFTLAYVLAHAQYVIGNDSGPTYLAAFLRAKGLLLLGSHKTAMLPFLQNLDFKIIREKKVSEIQLETVMHTIQQHLSIT